MSTDALNKLLKENPALYKAAVAQMACEASLHEFVKAVWGVMETNPFQDNWHIRNICSALEDITYGRNRFLLINLPPRCGKTDIVSICWPIWTWIQSEKSFTSGNGVRFLCASYGDKLTLENADKMRDLANTGFVQAAWGDKIKMRADKSLKSAYGIASGGMRYSTSIGGTLLGLGGDIIILDDPHNTESVESDKERDASIRGWKELSSTRLNDPRLTAIVVVMQRLHELDVSGHIISGKDYGKWVHIMYPMRHDPARHCDSDPRTENRELMWPKRYGEKEVANIERDLGPYMSSGRLQQSPSPEGGGIIKADYWKLWPPDGEEFGEDGLPARKMEFPVMDYIIASVDTAYSAKTDADYNALAILGLWRREGLPKIMLMHCWQKRLDFRGEVLPRLPDEREEDYKKRRKKGWGMLEWTAFECKRFNVDKLLVEGRATGITLAQEIRKVYREESWSTQVVEPKSDKVARVYSVQHLFAEGMIYAPERDWAQGCIDEFSVFPKGRNDDRVDAVVMGIRHLRETGWALRREETKAIDAAKNLHTSRTTPLYDV